MFLKRINPNTREVEFQTIAADLGFSPNVIGVQKKNDHWMVAMEDLGEMNLADYYGTDPSDIPEWIWDAIRAMVRTLLGEGIEYRDITAYNFILKGDDVFMIDFGDAREREDELDPFVEKFLNGKNSWNPDYK